MAPVEDLRPKWKLKAKCRGLDTDMFFPEKGGDIRGKIDAAKAVCAECPVRVDCLDYALGFITGNFISLPGIYGGLTEMERRRLWRLTRQQTNPTGETNGNDQ